MPLKNWPLVGWRRLSKRENRIIFLSLFSNGPPVGWRTQIELNRFKMKYRTNRFWLYHTAAYSSVLRRSSKRRRYKPRQIGDATYERRKLSKAINRWETKPTPKLKFYSILGCPFLVRLGRPPIFPSIILI